MRSCQWPRFLPLRCQVAPGRSSRLALVLGVALLLSVLPLASPPAVAGTAPGSYTNPVTPRLSTGRVVESCPDPSVMRGRGRYAAQWYMYCTSNPLHDGDSTRRLPMLVSRNLVDWRFVGSALPGRPTWAAAGAHLWAPDVAYSTTYRRYYLTYAVTNTVDSLSGERGCRQDPAIGVATSASPVGPWRHASAPVVRPLRLGSGCSFASTIDPDVLGETLGSRGVLYFGGFRGGIQAQKVTLSRYRMALVSGTRRSITSERYEAANVVAKDGYYYLFASAGACCNGPLSGYGVLAGRATGPLGPFSDREGNSLLAARSGGTPVLSSSGNRWMGPGHNSVFRDFGGQWWTMYHAIDLFDPYFAARPGFTRRPVLLDPLDWVGGWPSVRSGHGASTTPTPRPAAQSGQRSGYRPSPAAVDDLPGALVAEASDELDGDSLDSPWGWVREPDATTYRHTGAALELKTHAGDLSGADGAPALIRPAPQGDYVVETALRLDVPSSGRVAGHVRAGLVVYADDDRLVSLLHGARGTIRMTELGKKVPASPGLPWFGAMSGGPPGEVTRLRLVHRSSGGSDRFTAYTQQDDRRWIRGGTWVYDGLGSAGRIGLVALGGTGFTASFDYFRTWTLS